MVEYLAFSHLYVSRSIAFLLLNIPFHFLWQHLSFEHYLQAVSTSNYPLHFRRDRAPLESMFQEVIMFEISVSPLFSILHGRSQGCDEDHLRFSISAMLKRNLIVENANVRKLISIRKEQFPKTSHEVDRTGGRSMAGKERWTEIVQMETKQAESGRSQSLRESDIHREVISRRTERRDSM